MFTRDDISKFYSGMTPDGKLICTPWFEKICARYQGRAQAFDAAPERQPDPHDRAREERNRELQAAYDACRGNRVATVADVAKMDDALFPGFDVRTHAAETIGRFKRTHGMDALPDADVQRLYDLERSYEYARTESRKAQKTPAITFGGVPALLALLLAVFLPLRAQGPLPVPIYGTPVGVPPIGGACQLVPFNSTPNYFLTASGLVVSCEVTPPATSGVWSVLQTFNSFQAGGSAVGMNGSDQTLYSVSLPPLRPGGCWNIAYGIGAGLNTATLKLKIDGTTISQPFSTGSLTAVNVSLSALQYCNVPGSQATQSLIYTLGAASFLTFATPNSAWDYSTGATGTENDPPIGTPSAIDWSKSQRTHVDRESSQRQCDAAIPQRTRGPLMFKGMQHLPQFSLGTPTMPDFSQTNLTSYEQFVKPKAKPSPPLADRLIAARFDMHRSGAAQETISQCDALIVEFSALEKRIEAFLIESRSKHVAALEAKRADLWSEARAAETSVKAAMAELGRLNGQINSQSTAVNAWRDKAADAARRPFESNFPTQEELDSWGAKRAEVAAELAKHEARLQDLRRESQFAEVARHDAGQQLEKLVEELRAVDVELSR